MKLNHYHINLNNEEIKYMRYTLHDYAGKKLGESESAQGIGDIATHGTFSLDSKPDVAFPFTVFQAEGGHIVGRMYECETEAMEKIRSLKIKRKSSFLKR